MAQKVVGYVRFQVPAGKATPAPPVGPALGQYGVNIGQFTKDFNERTKGDMGMMIPVVITVYSDRSFTFITKTPPAALLIKKACGIETASGVPQRDKVATISKADVQKIAELKKPDLNAATLEAAMSMIAGTARSMGVRIEHRQADINAAQYGAAAERLPAADYSLSCHLPDGSSAYTFCMCPGGEVFAAASEAGGVCTNGMSNSRRDGENANAAVLVTLRPEDFPDKSTLGGMYWQRSIEQRAFARGGGNYHAPAQLAGDFLAGRASTGPGRVQPTYRPGVTWCDLHDMLPARITDTLAQALPAFGRKLRGFDDPDAVLTAPETRSSSPVRIVRGEDRCSTGVPGLYPCGEGAGYAGGITSAAVDGLRCAESVLTALQNEA